MKSSNNTASIWKGLSLILSLLLAFAAFQIFSLSGVERSVDLSELTLDEQYEYRRAELEKLIQENGVKDLPSDGELIDAQLKGFANALDDRYTVYLTDEETQGLENQINTEYSGVGMRLEEPEVGVYQVVEVFDGSPAEGAGILKGDYIISVDEEESDKIETIDLLISKIIGPEDTNVNIGVRNASGESEYSLTRKTIDYPQVSYEQYENIAYIRLLSFGQGLGDDIENVAKQVSNSDSNKVVLDLRGNTGGFLHESVNAASFFISPGDRVLSEQSAEGERTYESDRVTTSLKDKNILIITDQFTASAAEILVGAIKDNNNNAVQIGERTFGKGVVQQLFALDSEGTLKLTVSEWFTPNGTKINELGINPEIELSSEEVFTEDLVDKIIENYNWETAEYNK